MIKPSRTGCAARDVYNIPSLNLEIYRSQLVPKQCLDLQEGNRLTKWSPESPSLVEIQL